MTTDIVHDVDDVVVKAEMISLIGLNKRNMLKIIIMIIIIIIIIFIFEGGDDQLDRVEEEEHNQRREKEEGLWQGDQLGYL